ncbi:RRM [Nesidiocoris tenuis]|uniref:RRM n=1 Tax=Nesidiocoris tenuis TaxID=355587 RepID=A0ABN7APT0_9HEMI|nr:RRM [Nesidiocoris tenuis]
MPFPPAMDQWRWNRPRGGAMRPGGFISGLRPGAPYMRPRFFPGHRGPMPPQPFFNLPKSRPNWMPRLVRLPHFPSAPGDPNFTNFPPPGSWPALTPKATTSNEIRDEESNQQSENFQPPKKKKRTANGTCRPWTKEAAELALKAENEHKKKFGFTALVVRFPDPEISREMIQNYHSAIDNVHFQGPCSSRYCFVTLKPQADAEKVMEELNQIKFGCGYLKAERKVEKQDEHVKIEEIDPFTLFVGNLPANISTVEVKEKFPTAMRIDVGYAQKMKFTRYAFCRFLTTEAALEAYKNSVNLVISNRSIVLRFRRTNAPVGPPGEKPAISPIEAAATEMLTVGAKLKAKREKAKLLKGDDSSDDDVVPLEDDESYSGHSADEVDDEKEDDEDDGEDEVEDDDDDDDDEGEDEAPKAEIDDDDDDDGSGDDDTWETSGLVGDSVNGGVFGDDPSSDPNDDDDDDEVMNDSEFFNKLTTKR